MDDNNERELAALRAHNEKELLALQKVAVAGERMNDWVKAGHFAVIDELLKEQELMALNTIKNPMFDVENKTHVYEFRALLQTADRIRKMIDQKIDHGIAARQQILQNSTQKEGE